MAGIPIELNEVDVPGAKITKNPKDCSVIELKRWLECHGLKKNGKKNELVERVQLSMGKIKVDPKVDGGKWHQFKTCVSFVSPTDAIDDTPNDGWHSSPTVNIPSMFNYAHVYHYLIESLENADEDDEEEDCCIDNASTAKPLRKGGAVLDSGFVEDLQDNVMPNGDYILRAHMFTIQ